MHAQAQACVPAARRKPGDRNDGSRSGREAACARALSSNTDGRSAAHPASLGQPQRKGLSGPRGYSQSVRGGQAKRGQNRGRCAVALIRRTTRKPPKTCEIAADPPIVRTDSLGRRALLVFAVSLAAIAAADDRDLAVRLQRRPRPSQACSTTRQRRRFWRARNRVFALLRDHGVVAMLTCAAFVAPGAATVIAMAAAERAGHARRCSSRSACCWDRACW